jgi:NCS1 family nucleobase:cation symporter-1
MTAILVCDYWVVRQRRIKILDLYKSDGMFWFNFGLNWKAFLVFFAIIAPSIREFPSYSFPLVLISYAACFINSVNPNVKISDGMHHFFQCIYFFGYASTFLLFWGINTVFPPPGNRIMEKMDDGLIEGIGPTDLEVESIDESQLRTPREGEKGSVTVQTATPDSISIPELPHGR